MTDGRDDYGIITAEHLHHGDAVHVEGEPAGEMRIIATHILSAVGERADSIRKKVEENIVSSVPQSPAILKDQVTQSLWPLMRRAALKLMAAKKLGRSVILRFHGDADGICGAFALTKILPCRSFQQNSAAYTVRDALRDMAAIGQESHPLAILLDFGSGENCSEGLSLLKAAGIEYLVIDHHPMGRRAEGNASIVNPFKMAKEASRYTAGYLACEIAAACGLPEERARALARIACIGDKSAILGSDDADASKALVLDYLAAHTSFGNNLDFYRNVMEKQDLFDSIARQADETIEEAAGKAMKGMKTSSSEKIDIASFPLEGIAKRGEWPPSSKITTRVYDKLRARAAGTGARRAVACIGYTDRSIIIRLDDAAASMGLNANELAMSVSQSMADFVEGGGGHAKAGAIRAKPGFVKEIVNELIRQMEAKAADGATSKKV